MVYILAKSGKKSINEYEFYVNDRIMDHYLHRTHTHITLIFMAILVVKFQTRGCKIR